MPRFTSRTKPRGHSKYEADVQAVLDYCAELEARIDTRTRYNNHDADERIWRLEKYTLEELRLPGTPVERALWPSFTSNGPRTYWNAVRRATTANGPRYRIKLPGSVDEDASDDYYNQIMIETSRHEHFATGVWASIDEQRVRRGQLTFQAQLSFLLGIRGGAFMRPWLDNDSRFPFQCPLWDPRTVAYETGPFGLEYVCRHYRTPASNLTNVYPGKFRPEEVRRDAEGNVEVYDAWWLEDGEHVWNLVALSDGTVLLEPYEHRDMDHLPVYLIRSFGPDLDGTADYLDTQRNVTAQWETIYTANKDIYPWINRILTLYGLYLRNHAIGPWHAKNTGLNDEQLKAALRPFQLIQTKNPDSSITSIAPPQMADEAKEFHQYLQGAEQRGSVPNSIFGQIPFELSGFAVNQLQGAVSMVAGPIVQQMAWAYRLCTEEFVTQFRQRGRSATVKGMDTRRQQFIEDIKRADLRDKFFLEVDIAPELPTDRLQQAQIAKSWKEMGIDMMTIADEVLNIGDPRELIRRMTAWAAIEAELRMGMAEAKGMERNAVREAVNPPPNVAPPETLGITQQHEQFQPNGQNISYPQLEAAGFATR